MAISDNAALQLVLQLTPPGFQRWMALEAADDIGGMWRAVAQSANAYGFAILDQLRAELGGRTMVARLPDWEAILGVARSKLALFGTLDQRRALVIARRREWGLPTIPSIQGALQGLLGYVPTIIETDRPTLTAANTHALPSLPLTIPASGSVSAGVFIGDNAPASQMGAQFSITITHPHVEELVVTLLGPDSLAAVFTGLGTGSVTGKTYRFSAPSFAGHPITGTWQVFISDLAGVATGTWSSHAGDGIFVEGIGRDPLSGADGLGANIFDWAVLINEASVSTTTYDFASVAALVQRWNPAHSRGYAVRYNSLGSSTTECVFDDPKTPWDGGLWA